MKAWSDETSAWLALYLIPGLGPATFQNLVKALGNARSVFEADLPDLLSIEGVQRDIAQKIINREFLSDPDRERERARRLGARILIYGDSRYPSLLREIHHPPMVLYARGKEFSPDQTFIAVVGSRNATPYGLKSAEKFGNGLAMCGIGVVSGLARGIDSAAHEGCLRGGGMTVAVLGTGIDRIYPRENRRLLERIISEGIVLSEFPIGTPPEARNFPIRNRIISGLSMGVVIVEATKRSGSLITASLALDQGREVFAVPGSIDSFKSTGTHLLIKQGAKLIENTDDITEEFGLSSGLARREAVKTDAAEAAPPMDESAKQIYDMIGDYPVHIDQIVREGNMEAGEVLSLLLEMELRGIVKQLPGKLFVR
jgi:DNA processing protein